MIRSANRRFENHAEVRIGRSGLIQRFHGRPRQECFDHTAIVRRANSSDADCLGNSVTAEVLPSRDREGAGTCGWLACFYPGCSDFDQLEGAAAAQKIR